MKKVLMLASVASMIDKFNMNNISILQGMGCSIDVAANFDFGSITSQERVDEFKQELIDSDITVHNIQIPRRIFDIKGIVESYRKVKQLGQVRDYNLVHCHSPIGGVIARLAFRKVRKMGVKVVYTAHGFHFFKGAPWRNWLIYFPAEWFCSFFTDTLITINQEDYTFAKKHMHAKRLEYIHGVGVDIDKYKTIEVDRTQKRKGLGIPENSIAVLSVGELNDNKNHETVLRAIAKLNRNDIVYVICGKGDKKGYIENLAKELGMEKRLILAGFRTDVAEIYKCCDIFAFPSKREGLPVSLMEAMAAGLPVVCSDIRGNTDLIENGKGGFLCKVNDIGAFAQAISLLVNNKDLRSSMGEINLQSIKRFDIPSVVTDTEKIYREIING